MSKGLKILSAICTVGGFGLATLSNYLEKKETEEYVQDLVLQREKDMISYAVGEVVADDIDNAVQKRFENLAQKPE